MAEKNKIDLSERFQDGDVPTGQDFKDVISSSLNLSETGSTIQVLSSSLIISGTLNITGSISCSGNIEGDSFTIRGLTFEDTNQFSTTESVSFGISASSDQHRFTGSVFVTGSDFDVIVRDSGSISFSTTSGSITFDGTSSFAGPINRFTGSIFQTGSNSQSVSFLSSVSIGTITTSQSLHGGLSIKKINTMGVNLNPTSQSISSSILITGSGDFGHLGIDSNEILSYHHDLSIGSFGGDRASRGNIKLLTSVGTGSEDENYNQGVRMFISSSGFVGIGSQTQTSNFTSKFKVTDSIDGADVAVFIENTSDDDSSDTPPKAAILLSAASNHAHLRVHGAPNDSSSLHQIDLGSSATDSYLTFSPNGAERIRISSSGNMGIGTTTPTSKLSVVGAISASGAVTASKVWVQGDELQIGDGLFTSASLAAGGGGAVSSVTNGVSMSVALFAGSDTLGGNERLRFNGQSLLITGSSSPLTVKRQGSGGLFENDIARFLDQSNNIQFNFADDGDLVTQGIIHCSGALETNQLHLFNKKGGSATGIIFAGQNNPGAGAGSATSLTSHNGEDYESYRILGGNPLPYASHGTDGGFMMHSLGGGTYEDPNGAEVTQFANAFKFFEVTSQTPLTTSNQNDITEFGTDRYFYGRGVLYARNASLSSTTHLTDNSSRCVTWGHNGASANTGDTTGVRVGIAGEGDHAGTNRLYVHGTIKSTQASNNTSSDRRFKENIKDLESQLDVIKKLKPRRFDWKNDSPNYKDRGDKVKNQPGLIAQEVEDLISNMIIKDNTPEGYMTLNYGELIPILLKATQEQQEIIESLTKRIEDLENK